MKTEKNLKREAHIVDVVLRALKGEKRSIQRDIDHITQRPGYQGHKQVNPPVKPLKARIEDERVIIH